MKDLQRAINRNPVYFTGCIVFFTVLSIFCLAMSKADGFMLINRFHNHLLDYFFILFTNVGNGFFVMAVMLFLLLRKKHAWTAQITISFLISGLLVQLMKHFTACPRPKLFFGSGAIHYISGITRTGYSSFPSGHTATIFMLTTLLCLYFPGRKPGFIFFSIAVLAGYSRIYLAQHFPCDVLAGSMLGVLISLMVYLLIPLKSLRRIFLNPEWKQQSVKLR